MAPRWYQSLYWKIAIGFVACLAAMLVVQAVLFLWVIQQSGPSLPGQPPDRFATTIALDLAQAIGRDATFDVARYVHEQYGRDAHPFFVMMADGKVISNGGPFPEALLREARVRLRRGPDAERPEWAARYGAFGRGERGGAPQGGVASGGGTPPGGGGPPGPGGPPGAGAASSFRGVRPVAIVVDNKVVGVVLVEPRAPFTFLLSRYAPALTLVALGALGIGATLATVIIFGPARKRLRSVEDAARRLGAGDLSARAPARGGDEVAAVATAFNAMADDLSARADALATSDRVRRQLLADVSHELTTPVTAMRGYLETLTMPELALDASTESRYLTIISDETSRLERIIGDLLDLARLEGGGGSLVLDEDVEVEQVFDRVVARHERDSQEAGVRIVATIEPGAEMLRGDRDRIEQALQNLAANAMRDAPAGTTITLHAAPGANGGGAVTITVADEGAGIAPEHLPYVFDRFYKAEASRSIRNGPGQAGGSGLGLSIVKAIVERHGGRISVSSRPGQTIFTLQFSQLPGREL